MKQMLSYRTVLLAQTGICSRILPMALRSTPHQSLASSISASLTSSPQRTYVHTPTRSHGLQATFAQSQRLELPLQGAGLTCKLITNPAMPSDEPSNRQSRIKIESYYTGSDARRLWQDLQTITDYKGKHIHELLSDTSLPDELNDFYARFEARNTEACMRPSAVLDDCVIMLSNASIKGPSGRFASLGSSQLAFPLSSVIVFKPCHIRQVSESVLLNITPV